MKRLFILLAVAMLSLSSCALLRELFASVFQQPTVRFKNVSLHNASLAGLDLDTVWQIDNPNSVGLSIASVDYALFIDGKQVVAGRPPTGVQVPAQGSADLVFPANVKFVDIVPALETMLTHDTATWRVEGSVGLNTPVGMISFPLAAQNTFETPKLPQVQFANPRVSGLSLSGATVEFPLQVTNRSSFPIPVNALTGVVSVGGAQIGTLSTGDLGTLEGKGTKQLSLPLTINFLSAGSAAVNAIKGGNANLKFDAQVQSGEARVPLKLDQLVNFVR
jgi:LEA14-like dessication related protein